MRKIEALIHQSQLAIVILLSLLGCITEVHVTALVILCTLLLLSVGALIFFSAAKKRYLASKTIDKMIITKSKKTNDVA